MFSTDLHAAIVLNVQLKRPGTNRMLPVSAIPKTATDAITAVLSSMNANQLYEVMVDMKVMVITELIVCIVVIITELIVFIDVVIFRT